MMPLLLTNDFQNKNPKNQEKRDKTIEISQATLNDCWLQVDTDGSGAVSFEEFLVWYYSNWAKRY